MRPSKEYLMHHGVKGMRWGVRRSKSELGGSTTSTSTKQKKSVLGIFKSKNSSNSNSQSIKKTNSSNKQKKASTTKKTKSVSEMTDSELQAKINRLRLEQQYNQLSPKKTSMGKRFVSATLNTVVKPAVQEAARNTLRNVLEDSMKKAVSSKRKSN